MNLKMYIKIISGIKMVLLIIKNLKDRKKEKKRLK